MLLSGSPDCSIDRTFTSIFYFPHKAMKNKLVTRLYRNPIYLAKEYKKMIDSCEVKNQTELAKLKCVSRARLTQILNLLNLDSSIIQELEKLGDPLNTKIISERMLRPYASKSSKEQIELLETIKTLFSL